ncbi:uncharacterized protein KGF55_000079 [Candida pseudojiufengensis]|uniref:uncharacterized protein n=1 Tax=Candida pseudojiufengensis TaxID=497109 RepID=UPI00222568C1|nr:uncharacterized protein KGF55_000079 [Candida pseudojiufengensis]KAI5967808.1 hypothetical protein KGF55_000079 [Candida pseudojiufengensis]
MDFATVFGSNRVLNFKLASETKVIHVKFIFTTKIKHAFKKFHHSNNNDSSLMKNKWVTEHFSKPFTSVSYHKSPFSNLKIQTKIGSMSIIHISELPTEIIQRIINLIDDKDTLLELAKIPSLRNISYEKLFPKLDIFHVKPDYVKGKSSSLYFKSKFLNFLDDYDNYIPNEVLTNVNTLYELYKLKNIKFQNTKFNLIIHDYNTIQDLEFSVKNFKINSITLALDFDYAFTGKQYNRNEIHFAQLEDEGSRNFTPSNTFEEFGIKYDVFFSKNLLLSLRELKLSDINDLNSIKFPLSLGSLSLTGCNLSGETLDLNYLYQLKELNLYGVNGFNSIKLPLTLNSLSLTECKISGIILDLSYLYQLKKLDLGDVEDLNSIKIPSSLISLSSSLCRIRDVILDLSYLYQLKNFDSHGICQYDGRSLENVKLPPSLESICLSYFDLQNLNISSDYKNLKILKLMECDGSISLLYTKLPPGLEILEIEFSNEATFALREANFLYGLSSEILFPSTLKILKLTGMEDIIVGLQLNSPNLEELEIEGASLFNPQGLINESLINLKKLTVILCGSTMESVKFPKNLEYLNLKNNRITSLIEFNLNNLNKLKHLIVRNNEITSITEQIAPNLKILDISGNPIKQFHQQENLKQLILNTSKIDVTCINNLESFELEINDKDYKYNSIPYYEFDSCYYLKKFILRLKVGDLSNITFPDSIEILDITLNRCMHTQKDLYNISNCYNLKSFELKSCNIEHINFNNLPTSLESFAIIDSELKSIHGSLKNLKNLKLLDLKSNRINNDGLKNCLFSSPKIEKIDLSRNFIDNIDCIRIEDCPKLIELNLKMVSSIKLYVTDEYEEKLKSNCPRLGTIGAYKKKDKHLHSVHGSVY